MYRKRIYSSSSFVLNGLNYGIACLFDSFIQSPKMIEGTTSIEALHLFIDWLRTKDLNQSVFSTVIMAVWSLFNRMLFLTDLIPVHLLYCGQTVMIGCNHTSFEWTSAVRHIYGIIRHMQGLYIVVCDSILHYTHLCFTSTMLHQFNIWPCERTLMDLGRIIFPFLVRSMLLGILHLQWQN